MSAMKDDNDEEYADDVIGLYLASLPLHTHLKSVSSEVLSGIWFLSLTRPGRGGEAGGGISGYSREQRAWGQICLLGEVN